MTYVDGFVIAVPSGNRDTFIEHANRFDSMLIEQGRCEWWNAGAMTFQTAR